MSIDWWSRSTNFHLTFVYLIEEEEIHDPYFLYMRKGDKRSPQYLASNKKITCKKVRLSRV